MSPEGLRLWGKRFALATALLFLACGPVTNGTTNSAVESSGGGNGDGRKVDTDTSVPVIKQNFEGDFASCSKSEALTNYMQFFGYGPDQINFIRLTGQRIETHDGGWTPNPGEILLAAMEGGVLDRIYDLDDSGGVFEQTTLQGKIQMGTHAHQCP